MAKRYSEKEKRSIISRYLASGESCASYARQCGVSAITLRAWQRQFANENPEGGFVAITAPSFAQRSGLRIESGQVVLDFEGLPPVEWILTLLKSMAR